MCVCVCVCKGGGGGGRETRWSATFVPFWFSNRSMFQSLHGDSFKKNVVSGLKNASARQKGLGGDRQST